MNLAEEGQHAVVELGAENRVELPGLRDAEQGDVADRQPLDGTGLRSGTLRTTMNLGRAAGRPDRCLQGETPRGVNVAAKSGPAEVFVQTPPP